ncbi:G-protein coupled receptor Git3 [Schizosaccharomyces cryophilus OY26]|uniref:G-protein coupled receptor Git3 n=1 Tax=Schizosaccharomyces cryophilus (strain OY26 / ATCC MYA-4695 / CBS 11777 / NBRC 106824 / NRRL Y48691) TaxID=653667 RepID=S9XC03_SCHCR|nr:G-protein coupled receptor Git3 [Schizosaccharomyces cryophilus OY26]EPY51326.1 G-protein coupled receptor Git3 [Schizosaccharomyces cryophilus OY26]
MQFTCRSDVTNSTGVADARHHHRLHRTNTTGTSTIIVLTGIELKHLRLMVIGACSVSIAFCIFIVCLRFFRQKKKTFRDHIHITLFIVLLIRSIIQLLHPSLSIYSGYFWIPARRCFTLGFFLLVMLRMSDYWILINVLHNSLIVLHPRSVDADRGGLYRFRHTVYALSFIFPLTVGALAFTNTDNTFVNFQTRCFLPFRPVRFQWALNWTFDYVLTGIIFALHLGMFITIRKKIKQFQKISPDNPDSFPIYDLEVGPQNPSQISLPPLPQNYSSSSSTSSSLHSPRNSFSSHTYSCAHEASSLPNPQSLSSPSDSHQQSYRFPSLYNRPNPSKSFIPGNLENRRSPDSNSQSQTELNERNENRIHNEEESIDSAMAIYDKDLHEDPLTKQRSRIMRQSKFLFAYPAVFFLMWFLPQVRYIITIANIHSECVGYCKGFAYLAVFCDNFVAIILTLCDLLFACYQGFYVVLKKKKYLLVTNFIKKNFFGKNSLMHEKRRSND